MILEHNYIALFLNSFFINKMSRENLNTIREDLREDLREIESDLSSLK
jgi:hypothetical protein